MPDLYEEKEGATYICFSQPTLQIVVTHNDEVCKLQFNTTLHLDDKDLIAKFDAILAKKPALRRMIRKLDKTAAEKAALLHKNEVQKQAAIQGGTTSAIMSQMRANQQHDRDLEMAQLGADPEVAKAMSEQIKENDLILTQPAAKPTILKTNEGKSN